MTAKEAFEAQEILKEFRKGLDSLSEYKLIGALDLAIEALKVQDMTLYMNLPEVSAEEAVEILKRNNRIELLPSGKDTNVPNTDTISRQATITEIKNYERDSTAPIDYVKIVEQMPSAQPDARYINANELIKRLQQAGLDDAVSIAVKMAGHERLKHVPSAQPKPDKNPLSEQPDSDRLGVKTGETCTDTISRQEAIKVVRKWFDKIKLNGDICIDGIISLPSAQPERPKGEWIDCTEDGYVECPFCHSATNCDGNKDELHFCFSCGADMRGKQDG